MENLSEHNHNTRPEPVTVEQIQDAGDDIGMVEKLLAIALARLDAGRKLEEDRSIIYPEISVILHDVERLQKRLSELKGTRSDAEKMLGMLPKVLCPHCRKLLGV